ncbi:DUF7282 domain-containing protein [Halobacterium zhouii]|uniref:DUF7282 domain-containing protein n=1 Tax=Halobacterium zhouii TaxID=2902624 RepID=UPI001E48048C|nr:hypothetical protein [Halobacterium zhouii]
MTRTKMLAVVGVVLLVAFAGCGGTNPENVTEPTDGGAVDGDTTAGEETTTAEETTAGEETTEAGVGGNMTTDEGNMTTGEENMTTGEGNTTGGAGNASAANVTFMNQTSNGSAVVVANVTLPSGGFVAVHNVSESGQVRDVVANTTYLEAGMHENVTVTFTNYTISNETTFAVMLYQDTNNNQMLDYPDADSLYMVDGEPVVANATVTVSATTNGTTTGTTTGNTTETTSS